MTSTKWILHYGSQTFEVPDGNVINGLSGSNGLQTVGLKLSNGMRLVLTVGPGIPICVEEQKIETVARARPAR